MNVFKQRILKHKILNEAVADLFYSVTIDDLFSDKTGKWMFMGNELKDHEVRKIVLEASNLKNSYLWKVLKTEMRYQANLKMFDEARNDYDLIAGKQILFNLDVIQTSLNKYSEVNKSFKKT